jgi:Acetyltransferase (GNAT) domain
MEIAATKIPIFSCLDSSNRINLQLQTFDKAKAKWEWLICNAPGVTFYHRPPWIELLSRAYGFSFSLAFVSHNGVLAAGCVLARARRPFGPRFISLPFSDACAPLALNGEAADQLLAALTLQGPANTAYEIRGIKAPWPWHTVECFANWTLELDQPLRVLERGLAINFRRNVKRAVERNIRIDRGRGLSYLRRFYKLQLESRRRQGVPPQPWRFFQLLHEIFAPAGNLEVWIAQENEEDVACVVFFTDENRVHYKWGARRADRRACASHLLFWNAIEEFAGRKRAMDLGRTDVRNHGLMRFKKELGAKLSPVAFSFYPHAPGQISSEVTTGKRRVAAQILRRLPIFATRILGEAAYGFFA